MCAHSKIDWWFCVAMSYCQYTKTRQHDKNNNKCRVFGFVGVCEYELGTFEGYKQTYGGHLKWLKRVV